MARGFCSGGGAARSLSFYHGPVANLLRPAAVVASFAAGLLLGLALGGRGAETVVRTVTIREASPVAAKETVSRATGTSDDLPESPAAEDLPGRPQDSTPPPSPPSPPPPPPSAPLPPGSRSDPLPRYTLPATLAGRLVDAGTGKAIPGARVNLRWATTDGTLGGTLGNDLAEDGSFSIEAVEQMKEMARQIVAGRGGREKYASVEDFLADLEYSLQFSAKGYASAERGEPGFSTEVGLEPEAREPFPGSVRIDARWNDGSRYAGRLLVDAWPPEGDGFSQWIHADPDGTFLLVGVPAGPWNLRVSGKGDSGVRVAVTEAGEVRAVLPVPRTGVKEPEGAPAGEPREVEVSTGGHDPGAGAFVRAEARAGLFHRAEVVATAARFPALPAGRWEFVLQSPDRAEVRFESDVPAGPGRLSLRFPAPR